MRPGRAITETGGGTRPPSAGIAARIRSRAMTVLNILEDAVRSYQANGDTNQAAAIALYGILSVIPLFILTLLVIGNLFGADPQIEQKLIEGLRQFIPSATGELIFQFSHIEGKKELLGGIGIVTLIWSSSMIFNTIETALDIIFRAKAFRNYFLSKLLAFSMIPFGWAIGIASVAITYAATILAQQPLLEEGGIFYFPALQGALFRYVIPYLSMVLFFTILYKAIPTVRIHWKSALLGGAIFSALLQIATQFFTWYIANYTRYNIIFGSLEAVVILVVWFFYMSLILLFCAELISAYERRDMILVEKALLKPAAGKTPIDERLLRKYGRLYDRDEYVFREGEAAGSLFYILSGRVRLEKGTSQANREWPEMGPGEYFGHMATLIQAPQTASARCLEASRIAVIDGEMLCLLLRENHELSLSMLREFSRRLSRNDAALEALTRSWLSLAVMVYFLRMWPLGRGRRPVAELTALMGREAAEIEETLTDLQQRGILRVTAGSVTAFDGEKALQQIGKGTAP
jgi:membrane protein